MSDDVALTEVPSTPAAGPSLKCPIASLYSLQELQVMALHQTLMSHGVTDPASWLAANHVEYVCAFKNGVGMSCTVLSIRPKPATKP